jgi:HK97 family phage portal protein
MQRSLTSWARGVLRGRKLATKSGAFGIPYNSYMVPAGQPVWMRRDYARFAEEGYRRNVVAYRSIAMIATAAASVPWKLFEAESGEAREVTQHPLLSLLNQPSPMLAGSAFWEAVHTSRLIAGNAYIQAAGPKNSLPRELHHLRADRVTVIAGKGGVPQAYRYQVGESATDYPVDRISGQSRVLHLKLFHPLDDWYGLSPVEAAAYSIDQHNQASAWNQALLQHGARPTGALIFRGENGQSHLSDEQYWRVKRQIEQEFSGPDNAGRPILLEGGLEWKEMSLSPKEMDFTAAKQSSAREIALAFGVPPQLLGIPGDNTYANLKEARLALWEQTVIPALKQVADALNNWLAPMFDARLDIRYDAEAIPAISEKRDAMWERVLRADFLSDAEKRKLLGFSHVGE